MLKKIKEKIIHKLGGVTIEEYDNLYKVWQSFRRERDYYFNYILNKPGIDISDMKLSPYVSASPDHIVLNAKIEEQLWKTK